MLDAVQGRNSPVPAASHLTASASISAQCSLCFAGMLLPALQDRSFTFILKTPPASVLLAKAAGIEKGSGTPNTQKVGKVSQAQLKVSWSWHSCTLWNLRHSFSRSRTPRALGGDHLCSLFAHIKHQGCAAYRRLQKPSCRTSIAPMWRLPCASLRALPRTWGSQWRLLTILRQPQRLWLHDSVAAISFVAC